MNKMGAGLVSGILGLVLSVVVFGVVLNVPVVRASGTIYIRADGSIDPPTAPISSVDNVTYILTGNIASDADGIVIERDNITLVGSGYTVQGTGTQSEGILLSVRSNVTVKNIKVTEFDIGLSLIGSNNNTLSGNTIANNGEGIKSERWSSNNRIYHNNFIGNTKHLGSYFSGTNTWDDGYPSGGNYWSDYTGADANSDGIGNTSYSIGEIEKDRYPLMSPWGKIPELPSARFWEPPWLFYAVVAVIVAAIILALVGTVYFLKKRKPRTPKAPTLPTEGT